MTPRTMLAPGQRRDDGPKDGQRVPAHRARAPSDEDVPRMESVIRLETKVDGLTSGLQELKAMLRGREVRP